MIYFPKKDSLIILSYLICFLFCLINDAYAEEFIRVKAVIGVNSNISAGTSSIEQLAKYAKKSNVGVLILTDQALARGEYGIWPLQHLIRKVVEKDSILKFGAQKYLDLVDKINKEDPEVLIIPACEVAPFYWWQGSFFKGNLAVTDWSKQLIVIGLNNANEYRDLPIISNKYKRLNFGFSSFLQLWPALIFFLGLYLFSRRKFIYIDDLGRDLSAPNFLARRIGITAIIISIMFLINNFPFAISFKFNPYHGDQGILPYQRLIDYANFHNAMTFWMSVESKVQDNFSGINFFTLPHKEDLFSSSGFTGFSVIYGNARTIHNPGAEWDQLLNDYCLGKRDRSLWGIGETGFKGDPDEIDYIHNVLFLKEFNKKGVLDALKKGRLYAIWGNKNEVRLVDFSIKDVQTGQVAYMGDELITKTSVKIYIKVYQSANNQGLVNVRLIKNGEVIKSFETKEGKFNYEIFDEITNDRNKNFYRLLITGPSEIVSNPIFVKRR